MNLHVKSKERVTQFAEVLTPPEIVGAMLDLEKQETERIDSRFLRYPATRSLPHRTFPVTGFCLSSMTILPARNEI